MRNLPPYKLPPDMTALDYKILEFSTANVYRMIEDPLDKFIVCYMFDLGNSVGATAIATGLHRKNVWQRRKKIEKLLLEMRNQFNFQDID